MGVIVNIRAMAKVSGITHGLGVRLLNLGQLRLRGASVVISGSSAVGLSSNHTSNTSNTAVNDIVIEGKIVATEAAA